MSRFRVADGPPGKKRGVPRGHKSRDTPRSLSQLTGTSGANGPENVPI